MEELVKQAPAIGAVVIIVLLFIRYLTTKDQMGKEQQTELINKLDKLGDVIQSNTEVIKEHTLLIKDKIEDIHVK